MIQAIADAVNKIVEKKRALEADNARLRTELEQARAENERLRKELSEPRSGYIAAISGRLNATLQERFDMLKRQSTKWRGEDETQ